MSKRRLLIILGVWIMVYLFLGFPATWDKIFSVIVGIFIIIIAFKFRSTLTPIPKGPVSYIEHKNSPKNSSPTPFTTPMSSDPGLQNVPTNITNTDSTLNS